MAMAWWSQGHSDGGCLAGLTPRGFTPRYARFSRDNCFAGLTPRDLVPRYTPRCDDRSAVAADVTQGTGTSSLFSSRIRRWTAGAAAISQQLTPRRILSTIQQPPAFTAETTEQELSSYALHYVTVPTIEYGDDLANSVLSQVTAKVTVMEQDLSTCRDTTDDEEDLDDESDDAHDDRSDNSDIKTARFEEFGAMLDTLEDNSGNGSRAPPPSMQLVGKRPSIPKLSLPCKECVASLVQPIGKDSSMVMDEQEEQSALNSAREAQRELELLLEEMSAQEEGKRQQSDLKEASVELADALQKRRRAVEETGTSFTTPSRPVMTPSAGSNDEVTMLNPATGHSMRNIEVHGTASVGSENKSEVPPNFGNRKGIDSNEKPAVPNMQLPGKLPLVPKLSLPRREEIVELVQTTLETVREDEEQDALNSAREAQRELELILADMSAQEEEKRQNADLEEASGELAQALQRRRRVVEEKGESFVTPRRP